MTTFQAIAIVLTALWLALVVVLRRWATIVLLAGLLALALYTVVALLRGAVTLAQLGLALPTSWLPTIIWATVWLALMLAYSPVADWLASRLVKQPPTLGAFRVLQRSRLALIAGILAAFVLGGILEELIARGIVLRALAVALAPATGAPLAAAIAICVAAAGAGTMHLYQGPRAVVIITQLSVLFGVLFVLSGYDLWAVMLCHGLYDAIAFFRFANKQSKYSQIEEDTLPH